MKVGTIIAAGCPLDSKDIILYALDKLPSSYQAFKTTIGTNLQPLRLDDFNSLLCSEETNLENEAARELQVVHISEPSMVLTPSCGRGITHPPFVHQNRDRRNFVSANFPSRQFSSTTRGGRPIPP